MPTAPTGAGFSFIAAAPNALTRDPRYDAAFYQLFALYSGAAALNRQPTVPDIWVETTDETGAEMDRALLVRTGADALDTVTALTGSAGALSFGTAPPGRGGITIRWMAATRADRACGVAGLAGNVVSVHYQTGGWCNCAGHVAPIVVKHELGHALGFYHTDQITDLMHPGGQGVCDMPPSEREMFHARLAYQMPIGSGSPQ